jgi:rhodanese-related sulfurtransferase
MPSAVAEIAAAPSAQALAHFEAMLRFETDCYDVHAGLQMAKPDFVVLDVRGPQAFARGHVAGAVHMPHREIAEARLAAYPKDTLFVVYCAGPHCNGANRAAVRLAGLGRPVKMMIGGVAGWLDEGFSLVSS